MATVKAYTDLEQSKKLAKILPIETADMYYEEGIGNNYRIDFGNYADISISKNLLGIDAFPCWSLAALLNILHSKAKDIPSLSGGGYKDGEYISDWCLDYEFENGDYQKTFADNPVDACVEMVEKIVKQ